MKLFRRGIKNKRKLITILVFVSCISAMQAQENTSIRGELKDQKTSEAIPFANIALHELADSTLVTGTVSNLNGEFVINTAARGKYYLEISSLGYKTVTTKLDLPNSDNYNTGTILLREESINIGETLVMGERIKAKSSIDKTTYFVNKKIYEASNTGVDILKYIPGVQVDLLQNISLEGNQNIIIMVDGMERDRNFINQIEPNRIDKVEIVTNPGSKYDADVSGVINIILKKDQDRGMCGNIYAEVPTSSSEAYLFPSYSLIYGFKNFNLYTSYNGELSYFDIVESSNRSFKDDQIETKISSDQFVRQNNWSHRFHYGFDYLLNEKNQFNFYAFYNPYSREHDGTVEMHVSENNNEMKYWSALKEDTDKNHAEFYSLYYKHIFSKPGREIAFDVSYYNFKAETGTTYISDVDTDYDFGKQINLVKPKKKSISTKMDFTSPLSDRIKIDLGVKSTLQLSEDRLSEDFEYEENIFAIYGVFKYSNADFDFSAGLRVEHSRFGLKNQFTNNNFALLPHAVVSYNLRSKRNLKLSYRRSIYRPHLYQLNPSLHSDDPYSLRSGNPELKPQYQQNISVDYSQMINNNHLSFRLFYQKANNVINNLTFINDNKQFETRTYNLGEIKQYGVQISGALKLNKDIAFNPYFKLLEVSTCGNSLSEEFNISDKREIAFESGLSSIISFKHDITASLIFQYNSPKTDIQTQSFFDALYFISLEKTFKKNFKFGVTCAVPFAKSFTYQGFKTEGVDFYSHSEGNIKLSVFPIWLKFRYQFNSGKKRKTINRAKEIIEDKSGKGF